MKIIFYVAGMEFDGNTIPNGKSLGGSESAAYYLAKELAKRGHEIIVFSNCNESMAVDDVRYMPIGEPTDEYPFGRIFGEYATNVPHDVIIAQRVPSFFTRKYNSKLNLWWTHDLALKRFQGGYDNQLPFIDRVLAVSEFHKNQIHNVYGHKKEFIDILPNSVDLSLFKEKKPALEKHASKTLIYSSRPERGLENLVCPDGIMERIYKLDPEIKLIVCGYDNTTAQMAPYYHYLWGRCAELPNVELYGPMSKKNLASLMSGAFLHVYPTEFEETSCITAQEAQASGTPFITTESGALPETLNDGGVIWIEKFSDGKPNLANFVREIYNLSQNNDEAIERYIELHTKSYKKSNQFSVEKSADCLLETISKCFESKTNNRDRVIRHLIKNSDIIAAIHLIDQSGGEFNYLRDEIEKLYGKALFDDPCNFYNDIAYYNSIEIKNNHNLGNDAYQLQMPRIQPILKFLQELAPGSHVLDYGCCVGQQTIAYARAFPDLIFTGCDISKLQIDIANNYAKDNNIVNVSFLHADAPSVLKLNHKFDALICSEVLEHVRNYRDFLDGLNGLLVESGKGVITVPHGPHELERWDKQSVREHLHHFEERDLKEIFKGNLFNITFTASGINKYGDILGNYAVSWTKSEIPFGHINYDLKFKTQNPRETLSVCMICKPDGLSLGRTLESIKEIADEIIIGFDGKKDDGLGWKIAEQYGAVTFSNTSPIITGFDEARNAVIGMAKSDWILWIDDDEVMIPSHGVVPFLRHNQYDSYAIHQHHFSADPSGIMKTDLPCRFFRNHKGIKFYGVVHEHPETEINMGCGETALLPSQIVSICHNGYENEDVRRKRFQRNWPLMQREIKKNPDRELTQFLWVRDLLHINRFELERNGGKITSEMIDRCNEALVYFRKLISLKKSRLILDCLPYIAEATKMLSGHQGYEFEFHVRANHMGIGDDLNKPAENIIRGFFPSKELAIEVMNILVNERMHNLDHQYI